MKNTDNRTQATKANGFAQAMRKFELMQIAMHKRNRKPDKRTEFIISVDLAEAICYSVLNKCIDPQRKAPTTKALHRVTENLPTIDYTNTGTERKTQTTSFTHYVESETDGTSTETLYKTSNGGFSQALIKLKQGISDAKKVLLIDTLGEQEHITIYNSNGDTKQIQDKAVAKQLDTLCSETLSDGVDLVNDCVALLYFATKKAKENQSLIYGYLEQTFTEKQLKKKVYIKDETTESNWHKVLTTHIQEIFKGLRRVIMANKSIENNSKYLYIEDLATDKDKTETVYHRLPLYSDLGGYETDINGTPKYGGTYSASESIFDDTEKIVAMLNLTDRQAQILRHREQGYGNKAIATHLNIKVQTVQKHLERIREKFVSCFGFSVNTK